MRITTDNFHKHLDILGYYQGGNFSCVEQVRGYLSDAHLDTMCSHYTSREYTSRELVRLADLAIEHKEHWEEV